MEKRASSASFSISAVKDGADGNGIQSVSRTYAVSSQATTASDTTPPSDVTAWAAASPATTEAKPYLWAKEVVTYTKAASTTKYYMMGARGQNGIDAQDIEWAYIRTKTNTAPVIATDSSYTDSKGNTYTADDHLPHVTGNSNIESDNSGVSGKTYECTDDPKGVNDTWPYEWEIKREKGAADANGHRAWQPYSGTMTLHNNLAASLLTIDIDNDSDQFGVDADGMVLAQQARSTVVSMAYGTALQQFTAAPTASLRYDDGTTVANSVATAAVAVVADTDSKQYRVTVTVKATGTNTPVFGASGKNGLYVDISGTCSRGTKTIRFSLTKVMGGASGENPVIWQLNPSRKSFVFGRDASNNLTPASVASSIYVTRTVGNTTTEHTSTSGLTNPPTFSWGFEDESYISRQASGQTIGAAISISNSDAASHSSVWVKLSTGDRETLPILKDGAKGEDGNGIVASVRRDNFTEAEWATYGTVGHVEEWIYTEVKADGSNSGVYTSNTRNGARVGDLFTVVGKATDTGNGHTATYRSTTASGNLKGVCVSHQISDAGKDAVLLDLDNEADIISCHSDGKVRFAREITTVARLTKGSEQLAKSVITAPSDAQCTLAGKQASSVTVANDGAITIKWNFATTDTLTGTNYEVAIPVTYTGNSKTYIARFSLGVTNDVDIYQLVPSLGAISFVRQSDNTLSPASIAVSCGYVKITADGTSAVSAYTKAATQGIDSKYSIYYGYKNSDGTSTSWMLPTTNTTVTISNSTTYAAVEYALSSAASADKVTDSNIIDRETVPIQKDGAKGQAGNDAVVYSLQCSPAAVNFRSNAVGEFVGSYTVGCKVMKTVGNNTTEVAASSGTYDGMYLKYRTLNPSGTFNSWFSGGSTTLNPGDALESGFVGVEFALSANSGMTDVKARVSVPIMCDGHRGAPGEPGATGKMFYPMGEWDPSVTYTRTGDLLPLVFLTDMNSYNEATGTYGDYWYLGRAESDTGTRPASSANNPWVKANSFGLVITQGIFAEFAKLGKGIFSGDYLLSMNGRIGSTEYLAGATVGDTGRPAYLWFKGDTGASYPVSNLSQSSTTSTTSGAPTSLVENIVLMKGMSISIRLNIMSSYGTTRIGIRASGASTFLAYQEWTQSSGYSVKNITYTATTNMVIGIYMYTTGNVAVCKGEGSYSFSGVFEPNWWVDLLTGKMSAARGNFVVDSNGDVDVSGTIRAINLFHSTALCWGGGKCCLLEPGGTTVTYLYVKSLNRTESPSLAAKYGFAIGDYFPYTDALKNSDDAGAFEDGMNNANYDDNDFIPCTYSADIVELLDKPSSGILWPINGIVYLPLPSAFAGKMVEVRHNMTSGTNTASVKVVNLGTLITLYPELDEHGKLKVGGNSLTDQCTVNAGQVASFYSTGTYWVACGVV